MGFNSPPEFYRRIPTPVGYHADPTAYNLDPEAVPQFRYTTELDPVTNQVIHRAEPVHYSVQVNMADAGVRMREITRLRQAELAAIQHGGRNPYRIR